MKKKLLRVINWEYFWVCLCMIITLGLHLSIVTQINDLILDEAHYVKDARSNQVRFPNCTYDLITDYSCCAK